MRSFNGNSGDQPSAGKYLGTGPLLTRQALVRSKNAYREAKKSALDRLPPVASALLHMNVGELGRNLLRIEGGPYDLVSGHRGGWIYRLRLVSPVRRFNQVSRHGYPFQDLKIIPVRCLFVLCFTNVSVVREIGTDVRLN